VPSSRGEHLVWPAQVASTLNASFGDKQGLEDQHALNGAPCFVADIPKFAKPIYCGSNPNICDTVTSKWQKQSGGPAGSECGLFVLQPVAIQATVIGRQDHNGPGGSGCSDSGEMFTLTSGDTHAIAMVNMQGSKSNACVTNDGSSYTINAMHGHDVHAVAVAPTITATNDPSRSPQSSEITQQVAAVHASTMQVRRLTPTECERLQGFPDGWTAIPWKKKPADQCPDGPRYKALGNSMAVNCMEWLGERIQAVESGTL
jgi:DNA (cytosine-5)-methyltransferase 1